MRAFTSDVKVWSRYFRAAIPNISMRVAVSTRKVRAGETLTIRLAPSGGYAARLAPSK